MVTKEKKYLGLVSDNIFFIKIFNDIGLKSSYIGYYYLIAIMDMLINKEFKAKSFCKNIYPVVAKLFNKSACTVERDIRILIDSCWNNELKTNLNCEFVINKPSCCRFIMIIKNFITSIIC